MNSIKTLIIPILTFLLLSFLIPFPLYAESLKDKYSFPEYDDAVTYIQKFEYSSALDLVLTTDDSNKNPLWYSLTSYLYTKLGKNDEALSTILTGIEKYPDEGWLYYDSSLRYWYLGQYENGLVEVQKGMEYAGNDQDLRNWLFNNKAELNYSLGKYKKSQKIFKKLLKKNPRDVSFILNSAGTEAILGNYKECLLKRKTANLIGVSQYGKNVGDMLASYAAYYTENFKPAKKFLKKIISNKANPIMDGPIGELSLLLNYKIGKAIKILEKSELFEYSDSTQILYAGLNAKKGNDELINDFIQEHDSLIIPEKKTLALVLNNLNLKEGLEISSELYDLLPDNPYINYLYGHSLKINGDKTYKTYINYAIDKMPNNKMIKSLKK